MNKNSLFKIVAFCLKLFFLAFFPWIISYISLMISYHTHTLTYIYIYIYSCRAASTDIPDPLSPLLPIILRFWRRPSGLHPVSSQSCCMYVRAKRPNCPAFARPYAGVYRSISLMCSQFLQQCPACLVRQTWIVFVMGVRWLYSWYFVGCCLQDLFNIVHSILCSIRKKKRGYCDNN